MDKESVAFTGRIYDIEKRVKDERISYTLYIKNNDTRVISYTSEDTFFKALHIGSPVSIRGDAFSFERATNPGQFDLLLYYNTLGISYGIYLSELEIISDDYYRIRDMLYRVRLSFSNKLSLALSYDDAAIMKTMLLGERGELSNDIKDLYQRNGIAHILSISSLHISILGMGIFRLLKRLGLKLKLSALLSSVILILYIIMTGVSVSSLRAVFMFCLSMSAVLLKRSYDIITALFLSACLILIENPLYIYHSGFIFSYSCVLGIAVLFPALLEDKKNPISKFKKTLLSPVIMLFITSPVYLYFNGQLPIYSMLLNFLVIPVMSILVPFGFLLIMLMYAFPTLGSILGLCISGFLKLFEMLGHLFDTLPFHYYTAGSPTLIQLAIYVSLLLSASIFKKKLALNQRWIIGLLAVFFLLIRIRSGLMITLMDVGQGDGILMRASSRFPVKISGISDEFTLLTDGGSTSVNDVGSYRIIPYLKHEGVGTIDALLITHPDKDHYSGALELMESGDIEGIRIKRLILPDLNNDSRSDEFNMLIDCAVKNDIDVSFINTDTDLSEPIKGLNIECLHPLPKYNTTDANEASVCLYLNYGDFSCLFTGDIEGMGERALTENLKRLYEDKNISAPLTLLKVAHHGSKNSTSDELLSLLKPTACAISCGKDNVYNHPHTETLLRLNSCGTKIYRTDLNGALSFYTNGKRLRVKLYQSYDTEAVFSP